METTTSSELALRFKLEPWEHQRKAVERSAHLNYFGFFFEVGTGKTGATINALRWKYMVNQRLLRTLIVSPPITLKNWANEFQIHSNIDKNSISVLYGKGSERIETLLEKGWSEDGPRPHIFITNYEALTVMPKLFELLEKWSPEVLVFDECHKLKDFKSKRTKKAVSLSKLARYRYILSGTPILNSPMDLFSQFMTMDQGDTFGRNFFAFRSRYMFDKNAGMPPQKYFPDWRIKPGALEEINEKIKRVTARVKKADCLDLPPLVRKTILVEMGTEQKKHYEAMRKNFITTIGDKACTAELALTKALRLQQIASGYIRLEDGTDVKIKDNPRREALRDILEGICGEHKVLVWAVFKENYEQIRGVCEELKLEFVEVHGEVSSKARFESVEAFNTNPNVRVFIGHPGSGGIGINLIAASYSVFYSRNFSLEFDLQAEARNYRGGSHIHPKITRIDLVAQGTIDEVVSERLALKEAISEKVLREVATRV